MSHVLPLEIVCHIFSFLQYQDLYLLRGVSRQWRSLAEERIYLDVKVRQQPVTITIGQAPFYSTLKLYADSYDPIEKVVEFKLDNDNSNATIPSPSSSWQLYHHRQMQIKFGQSQPQHPSTALVSWLQSLPPQEQHQALLHLQYNPAMECVYGLPAYSWMSSSKTEQVEQHYVGDKSIILSFSYVSPSSTNTHTFDTHSSLSLSSPPLDAPQIKIHWLRVTLDWIISFSEPRIQCTQIYGDRYAQLYHTLARQYGCYKYDDLSEPVLAYIVQQDQRSSFAASGTLPKQLLSYIQEHTHEYHTRLSKLQHMLEGACVDPRMIWKYPFAKSVVAGNGSLLSDEDVVRRIQDSEEEWRVLKRRFVVSSF